MESWARGSDLLYAGIFRAPGEARRSRGERSEGFPERAVEGGAAFDAGGAGAGVSEGSGDSSGFAGECSGGGFALPCCGEAEYWWQWKRRGEVPDEGASGGGFGYRGR